MPTPKTLWDEVRGWLDPDDGALTDIHILGVKDLSSALERFGSLAFASRNETIDIMSGRLGEDVGVNLYWFGTGKAFDLELDVYACQFGETESELRKGFKNFAELALSILESGQGESCWLSQGVGIIPSEEGVRVVRAG